MNPIAKFIKENRKAAGLTQQEFALCSGLGLRFVRELGQGKETVRMDKVNVAFKICEAHVIRPKGRHHSKKPIRKEVSYTIKCNSLIKNGSSYKSLVK